MSTIGNSLISGNWEMNYIIAFLKLIKLGEGVFFRGLAFLSYIAISLGITSTIIMTIKRFIRK